MFKSTLLFYVLLAAPVVSSLLSPLSLILHCATKTQYYTVNTQLAAAWQQLKMSPDLIGLPTTKLDNFSVFATI